MCRATEEKKAFWYLPFFSFCLTASSSTNYRDKFWVFSRPYFFLSSCSNAVSSSSFSKHMLWKFLSNGNTFFFIIYFFYWKLRISFMISTLISPSKKGRNRQPTPYTDKKKPHARPAMQLFTPLSSPPAYASFYSGNFFCCFWSLLNFFPLLLISAFQECKHSRTIIHKRSRWFVPYRYFHLRKWFTLGWCGVTEVDPVQRVGADPFHHSCLTQLLLRSFVRNMFRTFVS